MHALTELVLQPPVTQVLYQDLVLNGRLSVVSVADNIVEKPTKQGRKQVNEKERKKINFLVFNLAPTQPAGMTWQTINT